MATKYEMSDLREKLIRIVESEWPMTLEEFEDYEQRHEELRKRKKTPNRWIGPSGRFTSFLNQQLLSHSPPNSTVIRPCTL